MNQSQDLMEITAQEDNIRNKYSRLSKIFLLITIVLVLWVLIVFAGIIVWENSLNWAMFSLETWLYIGSALTIIFIILNIVFYIHFSSVSKKRAYLEIPKPEIINGKRVHIFTFPHGVDGGIFSKTYVKIDDHNVLRLRLLMMSPDEVWHKKE